MLRLLILVTLFIFSNIVNILNAQNLKRKAGLGVSMYNQIPDSLKTKLGYESGALIIPEYAIEKKFILALENPTA